MIVSLDILKKTLGLPLDGTDLDDSLTLHIKAASEWVEGQTHRRFDTPTLRTDYVPGDGRREIVLAGHIDDSPEANTDPATGPSQSVHVYRRPTLEPYRDWEELTEIDDWERREDSLIFIPVWGVWPYEDELKVVYQDGYAEAPADIQALIIEVAVGMYFANLAYASGGAGLTSESLGDFSYSRDLKISSANISGGGELSALSRMTLSKYRRRLV